MDWSCLLQIHEFHQSLGCGAALSITHRQKGLSISFAIEIVWTERRMGKPYLYFQSQQCKDGINSRWN
jgi:hypothetical protein